MNGIKIFHACSVTESLEGNLFGFEGKIPAVGTRVANEDETTHTNEPHSSVVREDRSPAYGATNFREGARALFCCQDCLA